MSNDGLRFLVLCIFLFPIPLFCQGPTFTGDIQPLIIKHCTPCHRNGGSAPFQLKTYEEVKSKASFISYVTKTGYMPPWKADPEYRTFKNQRLLKNEELKLFDDWIKAGMVFSDSNNLKPGNEVKLKVLSNTKADLTLTMGEPHIISDDLKDDYRFFILPTGLQEDKYISAIEFIPGNRELVHHARVMTDTTNMIRPINGLSEFDPEMLEYRKIPLENEFLFGWVPGSDRIDFPDGMAMEIKKNTDLILNIHYAPTSVKQKDQSSIKFHFEDGPVRSMVETLTLTEDLIINPPFRIPANQIRNFYMASDSLENDIELISVLPHMHLLGKNFTAFAVTASGERINLVKIPEWDFDWQITYEFENLLLLPEGSVIYVEATYDNTADNPANPFFPPRDIEYGWNTTNEMLNLIIYYVDKDQEM